YNRKFRTVFCSFVEGGAQASGGRGGSDRHSERPLSARRHAGLLRPSRPCPPRAHPPKGSIGPYLVIRPEADLALVAHTLDRSDQFRAPSFCENTAAIIHQVQAKHVPEPPSIGLSSI